MRLIDEDELIKELKFYDYINEYEHKLEAIVNSIPTATPDLISALETIKAECEKNIYDGCGVCPLVDICDDCFNYSPIEFSSAIWEVKARLNATDINVGSKSESEG